LIGDGEATVAERVAGDDRLDAISLPIDTGLLLATRTA
jgi:hypothetical protein